MGGGESSSSETFSWQPWFGQDGLSRAGRVRLVRDCAFGQVGHGARRYRSSWLEAGKEGGGGWERGGTSSSNSNRGEGVGM